MKYSLIVSDPPWSFKDSLKMSDVARGASSNYNTMTNQDILNLDVESISDPGGCLLALWVPSSMLQLGLDVMSKWGFEMKQTFVWVKIKKDPFKKLSKDLNTALNIGMGRLFRNTHEICLIGINTPKIYQKLLNKSQRTVSLFENTKHSKKPEDLQDRLEIMFGKNINKIELFGRRERDGWDVIGNESPSSYGTDIRKSIEDLKNK
jgi:N6-adenosine-specific RNA methylase IME4